MDAELQGALLDVRKAFRLLHGYHRRIRDIVELAARVLPMTPYGQSTSVTPMTGNRTPLNDWWTWDCTPTFNWTFFFRERAAPAGAPRFLLVMRVIADTGLETLGGPGSKDLPPDAFGDAAASDTVVQLLMVRASEQTLSQSRLSVIPWGDGGQDVAARAVRGTDGQPIADMVGFNRRLPAGAFVDEASATTLLRTVHDAATAALTAFAPP